MDKSFIQTRAEMMEGTLGAAKLRARWGRQETVPQVPPRRTPRGSLSCGMERQIEETWGGGMRLNRSCWKADNGNTRPENLPV